jgi:hypothetical protein
MFAPAKQQLARGPCRHDCEMRVQTVADVLRSMGDVRGDEVRGC